MKPITFILLLLTLASCGFQKPWKTIAERNYGLPGQAAPPDMVFIEGNDSMPSFYMGVMEEPNINYIVYLNWLDRVFGESYPQAVEEAIPKTRMDMFETAYNDPFITSYLTHPAFAYYPVTNLTWLQTENYLSWKTDRLNEAILIRTNLYDFNPSQFGDDNYATEANLTGQYDGCFRDYLMVGNNERPVTMEDGIVFSGFRLPTEAEWEYASAGRFKKKLSHHSTFSKQSSYPFGKDYYTLQWGAYYDLMNNGYWESREYAGFQGYDLSKYHYDLKVPDTMKIARRYPNLCDYDSKSYGLINMEGGVKEWVIDQYSEAKNLSDNWIQILQKSGFLCLNYDELSGNLPKDSVCGRMSYRFIGTDSKGKFYKFNRYVQNYTFVKQNLMTVKEWKIKKYLELLSFDANADAEKLKILHAKQQKLSANKYYWRLPEVEDQIEVLKERLQYCLTVTPEKLLAEIAELDKEIAEAEKKENIIPTPWNRVVRGGTWKNTGLGRESMPENSFSEDVGFRCVLPYSGMPVRKGYKIKWGSDIGKTKNLFGYGRKWRRY